MGLYASFDVINDFGYIEATETYNVRPDYGPGCDVFVDTFLSVADSLVPVDTGYLQSTLSADTDGNSFCEVETDCEYAQYPEYGTWCQAAQPYFTPALEEALAAAEPLWSQAEEDAQLEEQILAEEEAMEQQALALASQQADRYGNAQAGLNSQGLPGSMGIGGSLAAMAGVIVASFITAFITTTVQVMVGQSFSERVDRIERASGGDGGFVYTPDVIIT